jgi:DNA-binding HxlR family transcriptional regulator
MTGYGQYCAVARAHEALGGRWTLLIVRELLSGARRFSEIRRGVPRISRTMLSERLQALTDLGVVRREDGVAGPEYQLTEAGAEVAEQIRALAAWGQRWLPRHAESEDVDFEPLLLDMRRRVRAEALPAEPTVIRFEMSGHRPRFLLLKAAEVSICDRNLGFPEGLVVRGKLGALIGWWRGDLSFLEARRTGLALEGPKDLIRAFPDWFERYLFADIATALSAAAS